MKSQTLTNPTSNGSSGDATLALLSFTIEAQRYSLPVTRVVRIIEMVTITQLPGLLNPIEGIINLRCRAVPVMDLRHRFGLPPKAYGLHTPIILVDMNGAGRMLGLIVDTVEDVLDVPHAKLEATEMIVPPELAWQMATRTAYLAGVAKVERQMIMVLDPKTLLTPAEQNRLSKALDSRELEINS